MPLTRRSRYHLDSPLTTVILPAAMEGYLRCVNGSANM
jgi:hypothetical protein